MIARAVEKYIRMSPRKARFVIDALRLRTVADALNILAATNRRAAKPLTKAVASAFANAKQVDPTLAEHQVIISRITADGGPVWKRFRPAAFGRAVMIRKDTSHITVELDRANPATIKVSAEGGGGHQQARKPMAPKAKKEHEASAAAAGTASRKPRAIKQEAGAKS